MGSCDSSDRENECPPPSKSIVSAKRFRAHTKFSDDLNSVDHACVPRKLRSAMKKRNHRSLSPHLPKLKKRNRALGTVESCEKDDSKKPHMKLKQGITGSPKKPTVSGPITKDEEEAVHTLLALAGMLHDEVKDGACSLSPAIAIEEGVTSNSHPQAAENEPLSNVDNSSDESAKLISSSRTASLEHKYFFESQVKHTDLDRSFPCISLNHNMPSSTENNDEKALFPRTTCMRPEFSFELGLEQSEQQVTPPVQNTIKEPGENGLTLWRGLFSRATIGAGSQNPSRSAAAKLPAWVQPAIFSSKQSSQETCSSKLVSEVTIVKKTVKRSVAHVCISHFIQALKKQEGKISLSLKTMEFNQHKELKGGAQLPLPNCNRVKPDGMSITVSASKSVNFAANGNPCEVRNSIFPRHPKLHEDDAHFTASQIDSSKQSLEFLSLSTGGRSLEANTAAKGTGSSSQLQVPYLQSFPKQSILPFSIPQTHYSPSTYVNQISAAAASQVQAQLPQCLNTTLSGTLNMDHSGISKHEQKLWAVQLSAQYRAVRTSTAQCQFPNWQLGKQVSPTVMLGSSSAFPTSSLASILPKYCSVLQLQQPLMAGSSLPTEMLKIQHHLTPVYEETRDGFRPQTALTLQLL